MDDLMPSTHVFAKSSPATLADRCRTGSVPGQVRTDGGGQSVRIHPGDAQRPTGGPPLDRQLQTDRARVQVGPTTGSGLPEVDRRSTAGPPGHPQQVSLGRPTAAADAGALRVGHGCQPGRQASGFSVSERMSIRQPVSRAASRAFCPSRPMASDSW